MLVVLRKYDWHMIGRMNEVGINAVSIRNTFRKSFYFPMQELNALTQGFAIVTVNPLQHDPSKYRSHIFT